LLRAAEVTKINTAGGSQVSAPGYAKECTGCRGSKHDVIGSASRAEWREELGLRERRRLLWRIVMLEMSLRLEVLYET